LNQVSTDEHLDLVLQFVQRGSALVKNDVNHYLFTKSNRYQIIRHIIRSKKFSPIQKAEYINYESNIDFSDTDVLQRYAAEACLQEDEHKRKLWESYKSGKDFNNKGFEASSAHFYDESNEIQASYFGNKFFQDVEEVFKNLHRDYA
jgi:hypothetical protein